MSEREVAQSEAGVLDRVNAMLDHLQQPRLARLSDLYREVDQTILTTFAELDHFGARENANYWGAWPGVGQSGEIEWPSGEGPRIYGYLKSFPALEALLERLATLGLPTVIVGDGIDSEMQERCASQTMRFLRLPVDAAQAAAWCDIGLLNATHGMLSAMLLAGKPTLNVPVQFEQRLLALKLVELRAGVAASGNEPEQVVKALDFALANRQRLAEGAGRFAARYSGFNPHTQVRKLVEQIDLALIK